jgi:hypothetical protein
MILEYSSHPPFEDNFIWGGDYPSSHISSFLAIFTVTSVIVPSKLLTTNRENCSGLSQILGEF